MNLSLYWFGNHLYTALIVTALFEINGFQFNLGKHYLRGAK